VVVKTGAKVRTFKAGDRVISLLRQNWQGGKLNRTKAADQLGGTVAGVFSEYYSFPETGLVKAPANLTMEESATLPTAGLTAFRVLVESGIVPGQTVLVQGTGAVSLFALQIGAKMGFRMIATTGNAANDEFLRQLGAHEVLNYREQRAWGAEANKLTNGMGVDLVMDVAGGQSLEQSIDAVALNGEVAVIGFLESSQATINLVTLIRKNAALKAYTTGSSDRLKDFVQWLEVNPIKPVVGGIYSNYHESFQAFEERARPGKIVVVHKD
jgi:NADPH:quinone reductase-like Zn-dependent oxidoreductase